jgi:hypothetical protein
MPLTLGAARRACAPLRASSFLRLIIFPVGCQIPVHASEFTLDRNHLSDMMSLNWRIEMPKNIYGVLSALTMIAVVVSMDLLFFKNLFWERLIANIGIVLVFVAFYLRFLKTP